jgi:hypothetical protein
MSNKKIQRDVVRVMFHVNGGFTRVAHEATESLGMASGGFQWEIPTCIIPEDLRSIGSRFELIEDTDFEQSIPVNPPFRHIRIEPLSDGLL